MRISSQKYGFLVLLIFPILWFIAPCHRPSLSVKYLSPQKKTHGIHKPQVMSTMRATVQQTLKVVKPIMVTKKPITGCKPAELPDQDLYRKILQDHEKFILKAPKPPSPNTTFVVFVIHSVNNTKVRKEIRETWLNPNESKVIRNGSAQYYFIVGKPRNPENLFESDVLYTNISEIYPNLVLKELIAYLWLVKHKKNGQMLKIDGKDTVANLDRLSSQVKWNEQKISCLLWDPVQPNRNICSPWYVPLKHYYKPVYPRYCGGPAYMIPIRQLKKLLSHASNHSALVVEDVFFTGVLAFKARVKRKNLGEIFRTYCPQRKAKTLKIFQRRAIACSKSKKMVTSVLSRHCYNRKRKEIWDLLKNGTCT
ncbi:unnamed protein product, partial [Mesorhabditis belari]|uniref:Hexosyltransferase n=1 Tax=Mesorhabditis belari TaxID=2138241 RepID=A0AAF3EY18_9BILA